ncbi:MAG: FtsW/RodA/SpoVE family cell cycle protein [Bacteroidota bacterium]
MSLGARIYAELRGDKVIWAILAVLAMFSILIVYSSTGTLAYQHKGGNTEFYLLKHVIILTFGLILTYFGFLLHYERYKIAAPYLMLIAIPLLLYTIFMGSDINEARRWITLPGVGVTFQSSDFAELALVIYLARELTKKKEYIKDFQSAFVPLIVPVVIICSLIAPADLSTAVVVFLTCMAMMFMGRVALQYIALLVVLGVVAFAFLSLIGDFFPEVVRIETWISRFRDFATDTGDAYQVEQSKIAIANGAWIGAGPGNSLQRNFLPQPYSDFVYAIIVEEYGLLGGLFIMLLYIMLFVRASRLVTKSQKTFGAMVAIGLSTLLVLQALLNMAVAVNLVPVTGLTMPIISMGGTSLLFTCISFGIILSVSKHVELKQ